MSTELKVSKILKERGFTATRFFGGQSRGSCIQLTRSALGEKGPLNFDMIQLTRREALEAAKLLMDFAANCEEEILDE